MNKNIAALILAWHTVYVSLTSCIESARVVLDQSDRGTLLPDRVREMRGEMIGTLEKIPQLADLLEELTGETTWPMKAEDESPVADPIVDEEAGAEIEPVAQADGSVALFEGAGDYDSEGATPVEETAATVETPVEDAPVDEEAAAEGDATETP